MTNGPVIERPLEESFRTAMERGRIALFSAPCGFGKSVVSRALLEGCRVRELSADAETLDLPADDGTWDVLLLDELQSLPESGQEPLCTLLRTAVERRFVLLSRGGLPGWLAPFQFSGLLRVFIADDLALHRTGAAELLARCGVTLSDTELTAVLRDTSGHPLALELLGRCMAARREGYTPVVEQTVRRQMMSYFEDAVYRRFDLSLRRFLLELAPFEPFDLELARIATGDSRAGEHLAWLQQQTSMLLYEGDKCRFWPAFRRFLLWELEREYSDERRRSLYNRGALYYELHQDYGQALFFYDRGGDRGKVSELLRRSAELHPGMRHYEELSAYYDTLDETEIAASPALMQAVSMLCALRGDYDGSQRWYGRLADFAARRKDSDAAGREARGRLAWLDISLPQRGVAGLTEMFPAAFRLLTDREITLPAFSVTSALPSVMNGGKDFSDWSRRDDLLYAALRRPVEAVLGRDGVGLADTAIAESKFEKGQDVSGRVLALVSLLSDIRCKGTPDIEFAAVGLIVRSQVDAGRPEDGARMLTSLRQRLESAGETRFLPNIDAMLCRIALRTGDRLAVAAWYRDKAPRDPTHFRVLLRYQYFTQAMAELAQGDSDAALLTLAALERYCTVCQRHIDGIHLHLLTAIARFRRHEDTWQVPLDAARETAAHYGFVRTVGQYGAAILPLLERRRWQGGPDFRATMMQAVRTQTANYPELLAPPLEQTESLTAAELQVLRLLCADKSNAEIGQILDIRLPTVKSHVSHILQKLNVSRRSEAKRAAERLHLLPGARL